MNLLDLAIKLTVDDQASSKIASMGEAVKSGFGTAAKVGIAAVATAAATAVTAIGGITKAAVDAYASYEQLTGGVQKLFGDSADTVIANAEQAYKTAGLSANDYMETVTGFSASLISSLGGDTEEAARIADMAVQDMSDNANTFGTNIEDIQNAYQGFAKENYTMLDNLKLGYGGTKSEMERLIADANRVKEANGEMGDLSIESFADVTEAIHIMQEEMNIAGTTSREASTTIEGSVNSMKAAWENWLTALGDENANMGEKTNELVETVVTAAGNIIPRVQEILQSLGTAITEYLPEIVTMFTDLAVEIAETGAPMIADLAVAIIEAMPTLIAAFIQIVAAIAVAIVENLPQIIEAFVSAFGQIISAAGEWADGMLNKAATMAAGFFNSVAEWFGQLPGKVAEFIGNVLSKVGEWAGNMLSKAGEMGQNFLSKVVEFFTQLPGKVAEFLANVISNVASWVTDMFGKAQEAGQQFLQGVTDTFQNVINFFIELPQNILNALGDLGSLLINAGSQIIDGLLSGLQGAIGGVWDFVSGIGATIASLKGPEEYDRKLLIPNGGWIMDSLASGLEKGFPTVKDAIKDITDDIANNEFDVGLQANVSRVKTASNYGGFGLDRSIVFNVEINNMGQLQSEGRRMAELLYSEFERMERARL